MTFSPTVREWLIHYLEWNKQWTKELRESIPEAYTNYPAEQYFGDLIGILQNPEAHPSISREAKRYLLSFLKADLNWFNNAYSWGLKNTLFIIRVWRRIGINRWIVISVKQLINFLENYPETENTA